MLFPYTGLQTEYLNDDIFIEKKVNLSLLRLDQLHPVISGNKLFKLHYFIKEAIRKECHGILTFGGAYSNHLVATAYACKEAGLKSIGIVRGEIPMDLAHTLNDCQQYGMELRFISRQAYSTKNEASYVAELEEIFPRHLIIPEGGYHEMGAAGAALITNLIQKDVTHICCAVGTATTIAGLLLGVENYQQVCGFPVLKNMNDLQKRLSELTGKNFTNSALQIFGDYHFGGYAKKTPELISFMNSFYQKHLIPTDFVYTAKMMFGVMDNIGKDFFPQGSNIVCVHTGGLQGNLSLPPGALVYN